MNGMMPLSEDFFYWPPEEIKDYHDWCETRKITHKKRLTQIIQLRKSDHGGNKTVQTVVVIKGR